MDSERIEDVVRVSPAEWPGQRLAVQPGDLEQFAPTGLGLDVPAVVRPWDDLGAAMSAPSYYAAEPRVEHPIRGAPLTEPAGGTVYFDSGEDASNLRVLFRLLRVADWHTDYAAFVARATRPAEQRFLTQLRIIGRGALVRTFGVRMAPGAADPPQPLSVGDLLLRFVAMEEAAWGTAMNSRLSEAMEADDDWAKGSLAFGFMVENAYMDIYRIWSRAWLVTK